MKHSKGKRNRVRSHHALKKRLFSICSHCKSNMLPHNVCMNCGYYNGRQVIDVLKKEVKKSKKKQPARPKEEEKEHAHT